jgi:hypothetical protein
VAIAELKAFFRCLEIDREVRSLAESGKRAEAVALCLGASPGQSAWAFARFDEALGKTAAINQQEFDRAVAAGFRALAGFGVLTLLTTAGIALLTFLGLRPRLKEYDL